MKDPKSKSRSSATPAAAAAAVPAAVPSTHSQNRVYHTDAAPSTHIASSNLRSIRKLATPSPLQPALAPQYLTNNASPLI